MSLSGALKKCFICLYRNLELLLISLSYMEPSEPWLFLSLLYGDLRTFVGLSFLSGALTTLIVLPGTLSTSIILSLLSGT